MIILGIDPGLAETGWGAIQKFKVQSASGGSKFKVDWQVLGYGNIKTKAGKPISERLSEIHKEIVSLIEKYKPDTVAIEELFFGANVKTAMKVGEARGAVLLACGTLGVMVAEYTPLQIKIALTGYGRAEKSQVQKMVQRFLNLKKIPKPSHAADALACAYCHAVSLSSRTH